MHTIKTRPNPHGLSYRADIDGLRAIAVLSVVLFHSGLGLLPGGYVGVDVFFVISGYLICTILDSEIASGEFSFARFYERRIRRIFPALFAMAWVTTLLSCALLMPLDLKRYGASIVAMAGFASNIYFYLKLNYFTQGTIAPLLHTWSLAIEEQFYIFFPVILLLAAKMRHKLTRALLPALWLISFALSCHNSHANPTSAFYLLQNRAWELVTGALLSRLLRWRLPSHHLLHEAAGWLGVLAIVAACLRFSTQTEFPGFNALLPVLGAAAIIWSGQISTRLTRLLGWRPVAGIGQMSYSLYLWHWPIFMFINYVLMRPKTLAESCAAIVAAFAASYASWRWIEQPWRRAPATRRRIMLGATAAMALTAAFGLGAYLSRGIPARLPPAVRQAAMVAYDSNPLRDQCDGIAARAIAQGQACQIGAARAPVTFAVIGDSFGDALIPGMDAAAKQAGRRGLVLTQGGCYPLLGAHAAHMSDAQFAADACNQHLQASFYYILQHADIDSVVFIGRWTSAADGTRFGAEMDTGWFLADDQSTESSYAENRRVFDTSIERMLALLAPRKVTMVAYIPEQRVDVPRAQALQRYLGSAIPSADGVSRADFDARQAAVHAVFDELAQEKRIAMVDIGALLCGSAICGSTRNGNPIYVDDNHLSRSEALALAPAFVSTLRQSGIKHP